MTPLRLLSLALLAAAALTGVLLARRAPRHWPVAGYLVALLVLSLARLGLTQLLPAGDGVREGWALVWRSLDQGALLAERAALPAMALALWPWRRRWVCTRRT